ncbi:MAG TPA: LCP family protein [Roseiflexaceae bacterium]|nr:LCP family protein [Roseiflexaceae bacterium]
MPNPGQRPISPQQTARERVAARRRARRGSSWRLFAAGIGLAGALLVAAVGVTLRRADQALSAIQQEDPRRRTAATDARQPTSDAATALPAPTTAAPPTAAARAPQELPPAISRPFTVLLVGVDRRTAPEDGVRSDTLILVRVDPQARTASMLSIPRDSMVTIPNVGLAKINTAFSYGYNNAEALYGVGTDPDAAGGAVAAETVEGFLGVTVDYIAQVDFQGFERLVDSVGGVVVDVPAPLLDAEYPTENYGVERIYIPPGLQVMDGRTALIYARTRHASSDFDRGRRQQQVLRALLDQVRARGLLENAALLPRWAEVLEENVRTTLPLRDLAVVNGLAALARDLGPDRVLQLSINPDDVTLDAEDGADLYWNPADVAALVARWEAGPAPEPAAGGAPNTPQVPASAPLPSPAPLPTAAAPAEDATVQVLNGAAVEGIAGRVTRYLRSRGFLTADPETLTRPYEHTLIIDYNDRPLTRQALAETLGIDPRYVLAAPGPDAPPPGYGVDIVVVVGADYKEAWTGE